VCPPNTFVTSLAGQSGWGIATVLIGCSDGSVSARAGDPNGNMNRNATCSTGFNNIQVFEGGSCGLGRIQTWCKGVPITGAPAGETFGKNLGCWTGTPVKAGYKCAPPSKIIGIEGTYGQRGESTWASIYVTGITNYICSN
jgi:hypothetical protein